MCSRDLAFKIILFFAHQDLIRHERFVQHSVIEGVHKGEPIKRIQYIPHNDLIITGSASPRTSVVINDRKGNRKPYLFILLKVRRLWHEQ